MKRYLFLLIIINTLFCIVCLLFQNSPGYMDAEYHTVMGRQIAQGKGLTEPVIWNYLDDPVAIDHPSHAYWMPLPSLIAAVGFLVSRSNSFMGSRVAFVLLSYGVSIVTYFVALRLIKDELFAFLAGLLSILSGYYSVYSTIPDSFVIMMLCGGVLYLLIDQYLDAKVSERKSILLSLCVGATTGLIHLARTEGLIWFAACGVLVVLAGKVRKKSFLKVLRDVALVTAGYFLIMAFWYLRNIHLYGSIFPAGNNLATFIQDYDQLFSYDKTNLTFSAWWGRGFSKIIAPILSSFGSIFATLIGVQLLVFLAPFLVIGFRVEKQKTSVRLFSILLITTVVLMGAVFPYAGSRGGYLHASAVFQPLIWSLTAAGIYRSIPWLKSKFSKIKADWSKVTVMSTGVIAFLITTLVIQSRMIGSEPRNGSVWDQKQRLFSEIDSVLVSLHVDHESILAVADPPGLFWETGRKAVVTPYEGEEGLTLAASQYGVEYLILEPNHVQNFDAIYKNAQDTPHLQHVGSFEHGLEIYRILQDE